MPPLLEISKLLLQILILFMPLSPQIALKFFPMIYCFLKLGNETQVPQILEVQYLSRQLQHDD